MKRADLKKLGKRNVKKHYWVFVLLCLLAAFIYLIFIFFVIQTFLVASRRVFLEGRVYQELSFYRIFYLFRIHKFMNVVKAMAVLFVFKFFWTLTIVGGIIKYYSYRMVPYLLAENPDLKPLQAISLSRRMMDGHKWECFLLDLSFLGWGLLSLISFGLGGMMIVYVLAPFLDSFFKRLTVKATVPLCVLLILLFVADLTYSFGHPNTGKDITDYSSMVIDEKSLKVAEMTEIKKDVSGAHEVL